MHFNGLLNKLKTDSSRPDYPSTPLSYAHRHLTDSFYPSDAPGDRDKIRVTRDQKTGQVLECMKKVRLGNLDVYSPKRAADWRISVNVEIPGTCATLRLFVLGDREEEALRALRGCGCYFISVSSDWVCYPYEEER